MVMDKQAKSIFETFCRSSMVPVLLLNNDLICESSSDESIFSVGRHFSSILANNVEFQISETSKTMVKIKDKFYCAVITKVSKELYICQLFDSENLFAMTQFSGVYEETLPMISANGIHLNYIEDELKKLLLCDVVKENHGLDLRLLEITTETSRARGRFEELLLYYEISFSKNNKGTVFCLYDYVKWAVDKCNSLLVNTGRCVELNCFDTDLPVCAESKFALFGFIEMIQFALLYSPIEINPFISLFKDNGFVVFMVTCRGLIFVPEGDEPDLVGTSMYGLAIVRRFAQRCGAEFQFINENNNVIGFKINFPEIKSGKTDSLVYESNEIVDYDDAFVKFAEYKMQKVIDAWKYQKLK